MARGDLDEARIIQESRLTFFERLKLLGMNERQESLYDASSIPWQTWITSGNMSTGDTSSGRDVWK